MTTDSMRSIFEMSPVHQRCYRHPEDILEGDAALIDALVAADDESDPPTTALHYVAASPAPHAPAAINRLLEDGWDPLARDIRGATPIFWAARWGGLKSLMAFNEQRVAEQSTLRDNHGNACFHWWALGQDEPEPDCDEMLIDTGHQATTQNDAGLLPSHAALHAPRRMARLIDVFSALRDAPGKDGYPPIFHAAAIGAYEAAGVLIEAGCNPWQKAGQYQPVELAEDQNRWRDVVGPEPAKGQERVPSTTRAETAEP
ncbi:MAG: hypothetical protein OXE84_02615 [Rhodobacteraceae bacterium]|nr:hypothetical protein [Paracoccaceae bacterium]